jgi:quinohemoprotein amine dehydrogenase
MKTGILIMVIASILFLLVATQCAAPAAAPAAPANQPAAGSASGVDPVSLLNDRCTKCHTLDRIHNAHKDEAGWKTTTDRMISHGAKINADEQAALVKYLAATYK